MKNRINFTVYFCTELHETWMVNNKLRGCTGTMSLNRSNKVGEGGWLGRLDFVALANGRVRLRPSPPIENFKTNYKI